MAGGPSADDEEELGNEDTEDIPSSVCKDLKQRHGENRVGFKGPPKVWSGLRLACLGGRKR